MNPADTMRRVPVLAERLLAAGFLIQAIHVLYFVLRNSAIEWPFEKREFAPVSFTGALLDGINPYALDVEPYFANVYGPLYNLVVWPWAAVAGNGFQVHRLVSLLFIVACSVLLHSLIRRGQGGGALALCAAAVFFVAQVDDVAGLARPDALGVFLFLAALAVLVRSPSAGRLALASSALLVVLAFFTKPYFALAAPIGGAFFLLRRRRTALLPYVCFGLGWLALLAFAVYRVWSTSFVNTVYLMTKARDDFRSWVHLVDQMSVFARGHLGLLVALVAASYGWFAARGLHASRPAGDDRAADVRALGLAGLLVGGAALVALLGTHTGNGQLYYTQLILPFLLILVPLAARGSRSVRALAWLAFAHALVIQHDFTVVKIGGEDWLASCPPFAALNMSSPYQYGSPVFDGGEGNRRSRARARELIADAPGEVFGGPELSALLQEIQGRYYDNGQSEFCLRGVGGQTPLLRAYGERCRSHWKAIQQRLRTGNFARVLMPLDSPFVPLLRARYRLTARHPVEFGYNRKELGVFEPIPR
jgi:Dolichyl-phosphate-mannose-protein mannosyltransferase